MYFTPPPLLFQTFFIHLSKLLSILSGLVSASLACSTSWTEYNGHCYKAFDVPAYWIQAEFRCLAEGGRLASVHSAAEDAFLRQSIKITFCCCLGGVGVNLMSAKKSLSLQGRRILLFSKACGSDYMESTSKHVEKCPTFLDV